MPSQEWDYLELNVPVVEAAGGLNVFGAQGWELVHVYYDRHPSIRVYVFKRPKREFPKGLLTEPFGAWKRLGTVSAHEFVLTR